MENNTPRLLSLGLQIAHAEETGNDQTRKRLLSMIPDNHVTEHNGKLVKTRELLLTTPMSGTGFIPTETLAEVIRGYELPTGIVDLIPTYKAVSDTFYAPIGSGDAYAKEYAPGAVVQDDSDTYNTMSATIKNYKAKFAVTKEMLEDAQFDVIADQAQSAGRRIRLKLERDVLSTLLENSGKEHDTTTTSGYLGVKAIAAAMGVSKTAGFFPDAVLLHPQAEAWVLKDFVPGSYMHPKFDAGNVAPTILGLRVASSGVADDSTTYIWEYDTDSDIGMLVMEAKKAGFIAMRKGLTLENFDDPIRGLVGAVATLRAGHNYLQANALCRVKY